jgi:acid phosphatase (class A)
MPVIGYCYEERVLNLAFSREVLGVHFASDSEAGRIFARQFVNELLKNEGFRKDFEVAKKEIDAVKKKI